MGWFFVFLGFLILNCYLFFKYKKHNNRNYYQTIHILLTITCGIYFFCFFTGNTNHIAVTILSYITSFYLTTLLYSDILFFLTDLYIVIREKLFQKIELMFTLKRIKWCFLLAAIISIGGIINGKTIVTKEYNLTIDQKQSDIKNLSAAFLSDLHVGGSIKNEELNQIKEKINKQNVDIIFLTGDIFDEGTPNSLKEKTITMFADLKTKFGIYYIVGNHEYNIKNLNGLLEELQKEGIHVLNDEVSLINNQFYVIGRIDPKKKRKNLIELLKETNQELPIIVLNHRANKDAEKSGKVDIQLSGHTHNGQVFPFSASSLITGITTYGLQKSGNYHLIVTSGTGTWGIPSRIGSNSEIIKLNIVFK